MKNELWGQSNAEPERVEFFGAEQLREALEDYAATTTALLWALQLDPEADAETPVWWPHRAQMRGALAQFGELCRAEIERLGQWDEDGLDPEEVHEMIWDAGNRLVEWLQRMTGTSPTASTVGAAR